jgi:hypothetical protein
VITSITSNIACLSSIPSAHKKKMRQRFKKLNGIYLALGQIVADQHAQDLGKVLCQMREVWRVTGVV